MNLLEKYYLQGKGKLMAGYFRPRSIVNYLNHCLYRLLFFWKKER